MKLRAWLLMLLVWSVSIGSTMHYEQTLLDRVAGELDLEQVAP